MIKSNEIRQIHIEVSSHCNASCPNCPRNIHGGYVVPSLRPTTMTVSQFKSMIDLSMMMQLTQIRFCGNYGDPISCKDLPDILGYIADANKDIHIEINTNGGVRSAKWWRNLAIQMNRFNSHAVIFSIDGLSDTNHIYRRGVMWKKLEQNFKAFIDAGGKAVWEYLKFNHNYHQIDDARALATQEGFLDFRVKIPMGFNNTYRHTKFMPVLDGRGMFDHAILPVDTEDEHIHGQDVPKSDYADTLLLAEKAALTDANERQAHWRYLDERPQGIDCMTARDKEIYIDSNGYVYPCCFLGQAGQRQVSRESIQVRDWIECNVGFGNINAMQLNLQDIIDSEYFRQIASTWRRAHNQGKIAMCTLMCNAECNWNAVRNLYDKNK